MTISLSTALLLVLVAAVCGGIGKAIAGESRGGLVASIALGFIGALFGSWIAGMMKLPEPILVSVGGHPFPVLWSIIGSALFVAIVHLGSRGL